jgi:hypothetical protein
MTDPGYRKLNASALKQISKALQDDPTADIEATLEKVYRSYAKLRLNVAARHLKRQACALSTGQYSTVIIKQ